MLKKRFLGMMFLLVGIILIFTLVGCDDDAPNENEDDNPVVTWTAINHPLDVIRAITWGNGKFVAVGNNGRMAYSQDGITWIGINNNTFGNTYINCITYGNGKFVAGGDSIAYSTDGINWIAGNYSPSGESIILDIAYGNGKFVAVGTSGCILLSEDGINWNVISNPIGYLQINVITWGNDKFVAAGENGNIIYSTDGISWKSTFFQQNIFLNIVWGNNMFVAVVDNGHWISIAYSSDGVTWTYNSYIIGFGFETITFGKNMFIALNHHHEMAYSNDGVTWNSIEIEIYNIAFTPHAVVWGNDKFVTIGHNGDMAYWSGNFD